MAEPKKRLTSTRSGKRRSHISPKKFILNQCPKCKSPIIAHRVCKTCGYYKNVDVLKLAEKERAKDERRKAKEAEVPTKSRDSDRSVGKKGESK